MSAVEFTRALSAWPENPKFQEEVYNKAEINVNQISRCSKLSALFRSTIEEP
jgi:hypothetical protein